MCASKIFLRRCRRMLPLLSSAGPSIPSHPSLLLRLHAPLAEASLLSPAFLYGTVLLVLEVARPVASVLLIIFYIFRSCEPLIQQPLRRPAAKYAPRKVVRCPRPSSAGISSKVRSFDATVAVDATTADLLSANLQPTARTGQHIYHFLLVTLSCHADVVHEQCKVQGRPFPANLQYC